MPAAQGKGWGVWCSVVEKGAAISACYHSLCSFLLKPSLRSLTSVLSLLLVLALGCSAGDSCMPVNQLAARSVPLQEQGHWGPSGKKGFSIRSGKFLHSFWTLRLRWVKKVCYCSWLFYAREKHSVCVWDTVLITDKGSPSPCFWLFPLLHLCNSYRLQRRKRWALFQVLDI